MNELDREFQAILRANREAERRAVEALRNREARLRRIRHIRSEATLFAQAFIFVLAVLGVCYCLPIFKT